MSAAYDWKNRTAGGGLLESGLQGAATIKVAVVDTGADVSAPDLASKRVSSYDTLTHSSDVTDVNGHGTFVASLAAGSVGDRDGIPTQGGDSPLMIVKAAGDDGTFTVPSEAQAIRYAVDHGARIVNLSLTGTTTSPLERNAIQYAVRRGVLLVAAVGNDYGHGNPVEYPAALLQPVGSNGAGGAGLAVAASSQDGTRAAFSNTGSWVSLAAPGQSVLGAVSAHSSPTTYPRATFPGSRGLYGYASGTSFAAPQVARAAALVWSAKPSLRARDVAQILKETASGHGAWTAELGFGVIDVAAAVARAQLLN